MYDRCSRASQGGKLANKKQHYSWSNKAIKTGIDLAPGGMNFIKRVLYSVTKKRQPFFNSLK
jgi:hypothetical protein